MQMYLLLARPDQVNIRFIFDHLLSKIKQRLTQEPCYRIWINNNLVNNISICTIDISKNGGRTCSRLKVFI